MNATEPRFYSFGGFCIDVVARQLSRRDGAPILLTARAFETLLYLVRHAGAPLSKDELLAEIWPGRVVEENNLSQVISVLRKALHTDGDGQRYIVTEPGRGYRFAADVRATINETTVTHELSTLATPVLAEERTASRNTSVPLASTSRGRLPWLELASGLLIVLIVVGTWLIGHYPAQSAVSPITTIAVLPFKPLSANDRDEVFELGMADTLITKLSSNRRLVVRPLGAVRKFTRLDQDPLEAGRALEVGSVLEGQVQRRADHVHVTARLLSMTGGKALWAGTFDEQFTDVFSLQDAIAEKVATALSFEFHSDEQRAMRAGYTSNSDAYLLYLQGRYRIGKVTPGEIHAGMDFFRKAIDLDPTFALAYAALAEAYRRLPITSDVDPKEAFPLAKAAAQKALDIDDNLADAHAVLGWVAFWYDWDWEGSEREFRRALAVNPSVVEAQLGYGHLLSCIGRNAEAIEQGGRVRELDPLSPIANTIVAFFFMNAGQADEAQAMLDKALAIAPNFWVAHLHRGLMAIDKRDFAVAIAEFSRARESSGGSLQAESMLAYALARSGDRVAAQASLDHLLKQVGQRYVPATSVATIYVGLGDADQAIAWLTRAYDERDVRMAFLKVDHRWDSLRADPRFLAIATRMGLQ